MAFVPPLITPSSTPIVSVVSPLANISSPTISYNQILQSLGTFVYGAEFIYIYTSSYVQLGQDFKYLHFDANGNQIVTYLTIGIDPYQDQSATYYETNPEEIVLDGFSSLTFNLLPNQTVFFKTFVTVDSISGYLNEFNPDNFQQVEKAEGVKFFDDFCNYLIDEEDATKA